MAKVFNATTQKDKYGDSRSQDAAWLRYYNQINSVGVGLPESGSAASKANSIKQILATDTGQQTAGVVKAPQLEKELDKMTLVPPSDIQSGSTSATASKQQGLSYADYLEKYGLSEASGAAMSYADYLARTGTDTERDYQRTVREAETDYAKARAGYGSTGETLARAGMNASGYSDYITGAGFAAMQNAKVAAADTKALTDAQHATSYADYVADVQANADSYNATLKQSYANYLLSEEATQKAASQELGVYANSLAADGADAATVRARTEAYAKAMGYSLPDNLDDMIASAVTAYATKTPSEAAAETEAAETETATLRAGALEIVNAGTENALSGAQIRQQLAQAGYSDDIIDSVMSDYSDRVWLSLKQNVDRATTLDELYPESGIGYSNKNIDTWVREGEISEAQGAELKAELAEKRINALNTALDTSASDDDTLTVINQIVTLNRSGDLSDKQVSELMGRIGSESVQAVIDKSQKSYQGADKIGEPVVELLDQYNDIGENEDYYTKVGAEAIKKAIADSIEVTVYKGNGVIGTGSMAYDTNATITVKGSNGESASELMRLNVTNANISTPNVADGLIILNDKLYYVKDGKAIYSINKARKRTAGSQQNADTLMEILKAKATVID